MHDGAQQPAVLVLVASLEDALECRVEIGERDLGEEAEAPEVDAEDRDGLLEEAARREEGAVAAQHHERVREPGQVAAGGDEAARAEVRAAPEGGGRLVEAHAHALARRATRRAPRGGARLLQVRTGQDADRVHGKAAFRRQVSISPVGEAVAARDEVEEELAVALRCPGTGDAQAPRTA